MIGALSLYRFFPLNPYIDINKCRYLCFPFLAAQLKGQNKVVLIEKHTAAVLDAQVCLAAALAGANTSTSNSTSTRLTLAVALVIARTSRG